jgi:hypothetical protein
VDKLGARRYVNPYTGSAEVVTGSPRAGAPAPAVIITDDDRYSWERVGDSTLDGTLLVVFMRPDGRGDASRGVEVFWVARGGRRSSAVSRVLPVQ